MRRGVRVRRAGDDRSRAPPNAVPVQSAASAFEIFSMRPARRRTSRATAMGGGGKPRARAGSETARRMTRFQITAIDHLPIELARVTLSAYDLPPDGDLDEAFVARLAKVDVGDWVVRPRGSGV